MKLRRLSYMSGRGRVNNGVSVERCLWFVANREYRLWDIMQMMYRKDYILAN